MIGETKPPRPEDAARAQVIHAPASWHWIRLELYCRQCGAQDLWQESYVGEDYYHDASATCHTCGSSRCCVEKVYAKEQI